MAEERCWVKVHHSRTGEVVVAICDSELLGRRLKLSEGVYVDVSKSFYGGMLLDADELDKYIKQGTIVNLLGERAVNVAVKMGLVRESAIVMIDGVPHIQIFL